MKQALLSARLVCVPWSSSCTHSFSPWGGNISHPVQKAIRSRRPAPAVIKAKRHSVPYYKECFIFFSIDSFQQKREAGNKQHLIQISHGLDLSLVVTFGNQHDFFFPNFLSLKQREIKVKLVKYTWSNSCTYREEVGLQGCCLRKFSGTPLGFRH